MMIDFWLGFIVLFVIGTLVLIKLKIKRYFIIFLIRTQYGVRLIDKIARSAPGFWKFIADFAILISFSGMGAAYLSMQKKRKHLFIALSMIGGTAIIVLNSGLSSTVLMALVFGSMVVYIYNRKSLTLDFLFSTGVIFLLVSQIFSKPSLALLEATFGIPTILFAGLIQHAYNILIEGSTLPGVSPLLPTTRGGRVGITFPGYDIFVPWWYALIALLVTLIAHESAHGILVRAQKMRLKSTGLLTLGILPIGAFIEPDEKEVESRPSIDKMRLFAVGSFANFVVCAVSVLVWLAIAAVMAQILVSGGIRIVGTMEGYPAAGVLESGMIVSKINDESVETITAFRNEMLKFKPGEEITLQTEEGKVRLNTTYDPENRSKAYIGITLVQYMRPKKQTNLNERIVALLFFITRALEWVIFFNINIGMVNLVPIAPFDGGRMFREVILTFKISETTANRVVHGILVATLLIFLVNALPLFKSLIGRFI